MSKVFRVTVDCASETESPGVPHVRGAAVGADRATGVRSGENELEMEKTFVNDR